jgi:predicted MPP superfamily phosphohydrolase
MVDLINEQDADLVMAAGDFLTSTYVGLKDPETYAQILRQIRSKYGSYAVYGNHDVEEPLLGGFPMTGIDKAYRSEEVVSFIELLGMEVLSDKVVDAADGGIVLVCREDGEKTGDGTRKRMNADELMKGIDTTRPVLVLEHEPSDFANLDEAGADLVLSGHTHAGQIFPGTLVTQFFNENNYGLKRFGDLQSVVTSGIGFYGPPLRVGCDSEIMVLDIQFVG